MLIYPEDSIKFFIAYVGDVVGVPYGHIDEGWLWAIEVEGEDFVGADTSQFDAGFPFDHSEAFGFAGVEVVAAGDAGEGGGEAYLSTAVEFDGFNEAAAVVGVEFEVVGVEVCMVDVAEEGVPEVAVEGGVEVGDGTFIEVVVSVFCEFGE